jgi:hypothetical protein
MWGYCSNSRGINATRFPNDLHIPTLSVASSDMPLTSTARLNTASTKDISQFPHFNYNDVIYLIKYYSTQGNLKMTSALRQQQRSTALLALTSTTSNDRAVTEQWQIIHLQINGFISPLLLQRIAINSRHHKKLRPIVL